jgi:conjugal transfer/type IV secretion protein DotA/TraY
MVALTAGFILYYIVPFLPFIYFFFAVGGWVKGIFEAMVGVPLWALAHIRIDGEGLSGQAAINGYFLIFEIFLRPILIIFGFLASILIFSALVEVLNEIFNLVVANVGGFDVNEEANDTAGTGISYMAFYRTAVDELFFTIIYAVVVYMIGQSCFKLIDQIPNNILRWMNQNVATFNDSREDPAQGLVGTAQMGAQQGLQSMGGGLQKMVGVATG